MNPNSVVLVCEASAADEVNARVAELMGDPEGAQNLSRELSTDAVNVTHRAGHAWLTDEQCKLLSEVKGLTMSGAALDGRPRDHWWQVLEEMGARPFTVREDKDGKPERVIADARPPDDAERVAVARSDFVAKPVIVEAMKGEAAINKPAVRVVDQPVRGR